MNMPKKVQQLSIKPEILEWMRQSAGLTPEEASTRLSVSMSSVLKWESGEKGPTFKQVQKMAKVYKRPSAAFFLQQLPKEQLPNDFRRLSGKARPLTGKTLLAIRKARYLQAISRELKTNLNQDTSVDAKGANLRLNAERLATAERVMTRITIEDQKGWKTLSEALSQWRKYIEKRNIDVFQFSMELDEVRGLTLFDTTPFAIVLNSSDGIQARIFTLLHEYGHILLHEPGICTPADPTIEGRGKSIEAWCNRFAAAILIPAECVREDLASLSIYKFERMAKQYKVSSFAMLTRLVDLNLISRSEYEKQITELKKRVAASTTRSGGRGESSAQRARRERGDGFVSLVLENSDREYITYSDALDYLDVKTKHMKELASPM